MTKVCVAILLVAAVVLPARAVGAGGQMEFPFALTGQVREINSKLGWVILGDGTQLFTINNKQLESIREGATVRVSGEERFGKKIILRIEAAN